MKFVIVILLRNLDLEEELGNRMRMEVLSMRKKVLQCKITSKDRRLEKRLC